MYNSMLVNELTLYHPKPFNIFETVLWTRRPMREGTASVFFFTAIFST